MQTASAPTIAGHSNGKYGRDAAADCRSRRDIYTPWSILGSLLKEANLIIAPVVERLLRDLVESESDGTGCLQCAREENYGCAIAAADLACRYPRVPHTLE